MIPIHELLNKIKWDAREHGHEFILYYVDFNKLVALNHKDIKAIEGSFMIVEKEGIDTQIPLHRVKRVEKDGKTIWQRTWKPTEK